MRIAYVEFWNTIPAGVGRLPWSDRTVLRFIDRDGLMTRLESRLQAAEKGHDDFWRWLLGNFLWDTYTLFAAAYSGERVHAPNRKIRRLEQKARSIAVQALTAPREQTCLTTSDGTSDDIPAAPRLWEIPVLRQDLIAGERFRFWTTEETMMLAA